MTVCTPDAQNVNPYYNPTPSLASTIYAFSQTPPPGGELITRQIAQHEAFVLLVREVRKWSDHVDFLVQGSLVIRVTVTFISPELVEGVILNQILYSRIPVADFGASVQNAEDNIAKRDELLFLISITASSYKDRLLPNDALVIEIPLSDMTLTNSEDLSVTPRHRDNYLANQINLRSEPEHGYIAYPIAVESNLVCHLVIDPVWNTSLSLHVPHLYINQIDYGQQTWSMDYHSLIEINSPDNVPAFATPPAGEEANYSPTMEAPVVGNGMPKTDVNYWNGYWDQMSRFIWYHLSTTMSH